MVTGWLSTVTLECVTSMSHPKRADHFREWSKMMLEQAVVPDRLQYKGLSPSSKKSNKGKKLRRKRRKRFRVRKRQQKE